MAIPSYNFVWQQGEDATISLTYKTTANVPVDLTGYSVRMDVADASKTLLYTFNSADLTDPVDTNKEATLGGSAGTINIVVPRSVTLGTGALANNIGSALNFDVFLRDASNKQKKILTGTITIQPSVTQWA